MQIIHTIKKMQNVSLAAKREGKTIGFVPTMGALHQGHLSLIRRARNENDLTVLSIFVNPAQFSPLEDYTTYPQPFAQDKSFAKKENVDILFHPTTDEMYPQEFLTFVNTEKINEGLCGAFRPVHFRGVTTVVTKLLHCVLPDKLYLGQKDAQQAVVLTHMISDLNFPLQVKICPTIREKDGLAMSSRNQYLSPEQRKNAGILYQSLLQAKKRISKGERDPNRIAEEVYAMIHPFADKVDYVECVNAENLEILKSLRGRVLVALAAWFGKARLIDNIIVRTP